MLGFFFSADRTSLVITQSCYGGFRGHVVNSWRAVLQVFSGNSWPRSRWRRGLGGLQESWCSLAAAFLESEMTRTRVAIVVELLLDVDHVAAGVFKLSELGSATKVSKVAELGQP